MVLKFYKLLNMVTNNISVGSALSRVNKSRLKLKVDVTKDAKVVDVKASKNRELWEKQNAESKILEGRFCLDDVFFLNEYDTIKYEISEAISFHKEYCLEPSMLNAPYAILKANFLLNLRTKKLTKFVQKVGGIVILPNKLDFIEKRKILAFSKNPEDIEIALQCGAMDAGDESLVKKLEHGLINYEEFDQAVCHIDALPIINKLKPILKDKMPQRQTSRVGADMKTLVDSYINGYEYESRKVEGINEESHLTVPLGEINWPTESLEQNFLTFVESIIKSSSSQISGNVIMKTCLSCPPSDETFYLNVSKQLERFKKDKSRTLNTVMEDGKEE